MSPLLLRLPEGLPKDYHPHPVVCSVTDPDPLWTTNENQSHSLNINTHPHQPADQP
jgi:hypothetical protein